MKKDRRIFILIETGLAALAAAIGLMMLWGKGSGDCDKVAVIIQNSDDSQWTAFKYGLKMAAMDEDLELSIVNAAGSLTLEEEEKLIENEIANGADAVIVKPVWERDAERLLLKMENKVPIMLVETAAVADGEDSLLPVAQADNYAMGTAVAEELLKDYNGSLEGKTFGIVSKEEASEAVLSRKCGFLDALADAGAVEVWSALGNFENEDESFLEEQPKVDFIIALDDDSLTMAGKAAAANDLHGAVLYGIGKSTEAVYYLDIGAAECLVVPDEFEIGYQSILEISKCLERYFYEMKDKTVSYTVLRRDTLFSEKNQEILFTMSQ